MRRARGKLAPASLHGLLFLPNLEEVMLIIHPHECSLKASSIELQRKSAQLHGIVQPCYSNFGDTRNLRAPLGQHHRKWGEGLFDGFLAVGVQT